MKVHVAKFAEECRIPIPHLIAAGFELGFTSLEEAIETGKNLWLPAELLSEFEEKLEQQKGQAKLAARAFTAEKLAKVSTLQALEAFEREHHINWIGDVELERLYYERKAELVTTLEQARTHFIVPERVPGSAEISRKILAVWEQKALELAEKAATFKQAWDAYRSCPNYANPSGTLAIQKVKKLAKTKEQILEVCEHFRPYDPREEQYPEGGEAEKPSEEYLFFVAKLAALYPMPEA